MNTRMYTVESVTSGHPDKICDQISDAILDTCLREDPLSRVAIESFGGHGLLVVAGEVTTRANPDYTVVAEKVYREIGYEDVLEIKVNVVRQSPDIAQGVDNGGAGDQGIMYGFATDETTEFLPKGMVLAHALTRRLETARRNGEVPWLGPDGKSQVTIKDGKVTAVVLSAQHKNGLAREKIEKEIREKIISSVIGDLSEVEVFVNPTGSFVVGGFAADTGLTGRKIMVDTYGGFISHGGGCFSGKDPTKVDRSAAYMARFAAKSAVREGLGKTCLVSVAYAIGRAEPVMVEAINEKGESVAHYVKEKFDFRPKAIIERLDLRRPIYRATAAYGHFGRYGFPWEEA